MNTSIDFGARGANAAIIEIDTRKQKQLVCSFDVQLEVRKHNRLELGRIARELKPHYVTSGQREKGKGWEAFLEQRGLSRRTVDEWISNYESSIGARESKSVPADSAGTNAETKGVGGTRSRTVDTPEPPPERGWQDLGTTPASTDLVAEVNALATPEGRSNWLFKHALDVFERATKANGQALREWDAAAARVRKVLASYKKDEVENPNADFSPISVGEED